ncbi:MAG: SRPBCC family protein [Proteobacteria bacterium]|nr:SRPBCC family protein [Pseudomonadota bacterium]
MIEITVEKEINGLAEDVWAMLSNFGDVGWADIGEAEVEGEGVGMLRKTKLFPDLPPVLERLDSMDHEAKTFSYSILEGNPMPMSDMRSQVKVTAINGNKCLLSWSSQAQEQGVSVKKGEAMLRFLYKEVMKVVAKQFA